MNSNFCGVNIKQLQSEVMKFSLGLYNDTLGLYMISLGLYNDTCITKKKLLTS